MANRKGERPQKSSDVRNAAGHGAKTAAVRERAILALLNQKTIEKAATTAGVNEKTLRRWLSDDDAFKAEYTTARQATFEAGVSRIHGLTAQAVQTLQDLMDAKKFPGVRLGAARTVLELGTQRHEAETIMRRLDELETTQTQQQPRALVHGSKLTRRASKPHRPFTNRCCKSPAGQARSSD